MSNSAESDQLAEYDWHVAPDPSEWRTVNYDPEWHDYTARIAIDRPEDMNSYVLGTLKELSAGIERAMGDDAVQFIVLTGEGEHAFCTGGNVNEYAEKYNASPAGFQEWGEYYGRVFDLMLHCGIPIVSQINGVVAGGGWEFVACSDLAISTEDARFIAPGPRVGMSSVGGLSQWLPLHMSHKKSAEIVLLSRELDAEEALEYGAINTTVPQDELEDEVRSWLDEMKTLSPSSLSYYKVHHNWWKEIVWRQTWEQAKAWFSLNMGSMEPSEGLWAFKNGEEPDMQSMRDHVADGKDLRVPFGAYRAECDGCGTEYLPSESNYCLECGETLGS